LRHKGHHPQQKRRSKNFAEHIGDRFWVDICTLRVADERSAKELCLKGGQGCAKQLSPVMAAAN
jgi:hypothetical protein